MSKNLQRVMKNRGVKVPVKKPITRGGKTFQQTFWVSPQEAATLQEKKKAEEEEKRRAYYRAQEDARLQKAFERAKMQTLGNKFAKTGKELLQQIAESKKREERADIDEEALDDLKFYTRAEEDFKEVEATAIWRWRHKKFTEAVMMKELAPVINKAANSFVKELHPDLSGIELVKKRAELFPGKLRKQLAKDMAKDFGKRLDAGDWAPLRGKEAGRAKEPLAYKEDLKKKKKLENEAILPERHADSFSKGAEMLGLSEKDLLDTYATPDGYEFEITHVTSSYADFESPKEYLEFKGEIYDEMQKPVGQLHRRLVRHQNGDLHAEHTYFKLDEDVEKGVGTAMVRNQFEQYEALGVKSVKLDAAWVGKYLWLKLGFTPTEKSAEVIREFMHRDVKRKLIDMDQIEAVQELIDGDLNKFARMKGLPEVTYIDPVDASEKKAPVNKAMLLDNAAPGWKGEIQVGGTRWSTTMEALDAYAQ